MSAATPPMSPPLRPTLRQRAFSERTVRTLKRRRIVSGIMLAVLIGAAVLAVLPLIFIFGHLLTLGIGSLSWDFFTKMPKPVGETGGGLANAIVGTLILIGLASAVGLPVGVGAGLYLAEQKGTKLANSVRFLSDVLNGLPSIVMGIFAWQFLVRPVGHFSALAGGVALGAMMIPMVARTTEEMVGIVPVSLREAALALGYSRWRTSLSVGAAHRERGDRHRRARRHRAHRGRDGAAAVHRLRQSVLVALAQAADRRASSASLLLRDQPL